MKPRFTCFGLLLLCGFLASTCPSAFGLPTTTTTSLTVVSYQTPVTSVPSGTVITLTATVQSAGGIVTPGTVNFCDASVAYCTDIHRVGSAQLMSNGTAVYRYIPGPGAHSYKAVFLGTSANAPTSYAASTSSTAPLDVYQTGPYETLTAISAGGTAGKYTLSATVGSAGVSAPRGTISFLDASNHNASLGTGSLTAEAGPSFFNVSNPTFQQAPIAFTIGDFNGDGIPDIATVAHVYSNSKTTGVITILLGDSKGNFSVSSSISDAQEPDSIATADFDGDGVLDPLLATTSAAA